MYSPVINLKNRQPRVLRQLFFLVFRGIWMLQAKRVPPISNEFEYERSCVLK